jgi:fluoroacetyl-CoA thioesterase
MSEITVGTSYTIDRVVEDKDCTVRGEHKIFATPDLVLLVEAVAIEALAQHLPEGQSSVGSHIDISPVAPTLKGQTVSATTTVTLVDRRRVVFDVEVHDEFDSVSTGSHERYIVDLDKFGQRLDAKAAKVNS